MLDISFEFHNFNLQTICENASILIIGDRTSEKTTLIKNLANEMYRNNLIDSTIIISPTEKFNNTYDVEKYYDNYDSKIIRQLLDKQDKDRKDNILSKYLIILDDCNTNNISKDENLIELLFNGRHYNITTIFAMQYPLGLPPALRVNFDYVFLFEMNIMTNKKKTYEHYLGMFPTFKSADHIFKKMKNHTACVVINKGVHHTILEKCQLYKAQEQKKFLPPTIIIDEYDDQNDETNLSKIDIITNIMVNQLKIQKKIMENENLIKDMNETNMELIKLFKEMIV